MAVQLYSTGTEYLANALTFTRGTVADVTSVGVYHTLNPSEVPAEVDFTAATLITNPADPLAEGDKIDVVTLIGPGTGAFETLTVGDWQRWVMVKTANETIIRKVDVVTIS